MTDAERIEAAKVMAGPGPWEWRYRTPGSPWRALNGPPSWNWLECEYRLAPPPPAPAPLLCPNCHGTDTHPLYTKPGACFCSTCQCDWRPAATKPCPECADLNSPENGKRALRAARDEWRGKYVAQCERTAQAERDLAVVTAERDALAKRNAEALDKVASWERMGFVGIAADLRRTLESRP